MVALKPSKIWRHDLGFFLGRNAYCTLRRELVYGHPYLHIAPARMQMVEMMFHNTKTTAEELCAREVALRA